MRIRANFAGIYEFCEFRKFISELTDFYPNKKNVICYFILPWMLCHAYAVLFFRIATRHSEILLLTIVPQQNNNNARGLWG